MDRDITVYDVYPILGVVNTIIYYGAIAGICYMAGYDSGSEFWYKQGYEAAKKEYKQAAKSCKLGN